MKKNILITGANGRIASGLITRLKKQNYNVVGADLVPSKDIIQMDITNKSEVSKFLSRQSFDLIIHTAAISSNFKKFTKSNHLIQTKGKINLLSIDNFFNLSKAKQHGYVSFLLSVNEKL